MEYKHPHDINLSPYYLMNSASEVGESFLYGFYKDKAVLGPILSTMSIKKCSLQFDEHTGEKFICINGTKMKVVLQKKLPGILKKRAEILANNSTSVHNDNTNTNITNHNQDKGNIKLEPSESQSVSKSCDTVNMSGSHLVMKPKFKAIIKPNALGNLKTICSIDNMNKVSKKLSSKEVQAVAVFKDIGCQTEIQTEVESPIDMTDFYSLFEGVSELSTVPPVLMTQPTQTFIHGSAILRNKNDPKIKFFNDIRNALVVDNNRNMPIHDAVIKNSLLNVQRFTVALKALNQSVNVFNEDNYTPLQLAILNDCSKDIVSFLLRNNADITVTDQNGQSPLHLAVLRNNTEVLEMLCKYANSKNLGVNFFNYDGFTPLILSSINKNCECAEILLMNNASVNGMDQKSGRTALFHAVENHDLEMVRLLLNHKADTSIGNFFGTSPHDAMFEMEDIPQEIRNLIWASKKRKSKFDPSPKVLKIVKTYQKVK